MSILHTIAAKCKTKMQSTAEFLNDLVPVAQRPSKEKLVNIDVDQFIDQCRDLEYTTSSLVAVFEEEEPANPDSTAYLVSIERATELQDAASNLLNSAKDIPDKKPKKLHKSALKCLQDSVQSFKALATSWNFSQINDTHYALNAFRVAISTMCYTGTLTELPGNFEFAVQHLQHVVRLMIKRGKMVENKSQADSLDVLARQFQFMMFPISTICMACHLHPANTSLQEFRRATLHRILEIIEAVVIEISHFSASHDIPKPNFINFSVSSIYGAVRLFHGAAAYRDLAALIDSVRLSMDALTSHAMGVAAFSTPADQMVIYAATNRAITGLRELSLMDQTVVVPDPDLVAPKMAEFAQACAVLHTITQKSLIGQMLLAFNNPFDGLHAMMTVLFALDGPKDLKQHIESYSLHTDHIFLVAGYLKGCVSTEAAYQIDQCLIGLDWFNTRLTAMLQMASETCDPDNITTLNVMIKVWIKSVLKLRTVLDTAVNPLDFLKACKREVQQHAISVFEWKEESVPCPKDAALAMVLSERICSRFNSFHSSHKCLDAKSLNAIRTAIIQLQRVLKQLETDQTSVLRSTALAAMVSILKSLLTAAKYLEAKATTKLRGWELESDSTMDKLLKSFETDWEAWTTNGLPQGVVYVPSKMIDLDSLSSFSSMTASEISGISLASPGRVKNPRRNFAEKFKEYSLDLNYAAPIPSHRDGSSKSPNDPLNYMKNLSGYMNQMKSMLKGDKREKCRDIKRKDKASKEKETSQCKIVGVTMKESESVILPEIVLGPNDSLNNNLVNPIFPRRFLGKYQTSTTISSQRESKSKTVSPDTTDSFTRVVFKNGGSI